jgi:hypothetical protein
MHGPYALDERVIDGETRWVMIRARGAEWSWLTPQEAAIIAKIWLGKYGPEPARFDLDH